MKNIKHLVDLDKLNQELLDISLERSDLKKRQQTLRTRSCRLNKIMAEVNQLVLPLKKVP